MRRVRICEERGSGIDKVVSAAEESLLPPPDFIDYADDTRVTLYGRRKLAQMTRQEKSRACYQHACLCVLGSTRLTNASLRKRMGIPAANYSTASRIIAAAVEDGLIKPYDEKNRSKKHATYVPFWM
jgi:predicted HTH transcriptional regulator